ncbi:hypothetical protein K4K49_006072 [Colletotrichum sp. SAR 10_70]|nr:hypothetical protein K4K50_005710 [Colletotrichum sp. SAR 10_71]KAI8164308.1 hypothetical protein K4K49_006072 [Colletotrichum sp. SAR 10_70]KAJ4997811.1 hypothetical protein K4K48_006303 [Colletotrichum sp. SAR 10_66]
MATQSISSVFQEFLDRVNLKKWDAAKKFLQDAITFNEHHGSSDEFIGFLSADIEQRNVTQLRIDAVAVHSDGKSLGARQIIKTVGPDGTQLETWALVLAFFNDDKKISRFYKIDTRPNPRSPVLAKVSPTAPPVSEKQLSADELKSAYHTYIQSYNDGAMAIVVPQMMAPELLMNGNPLPREVVVGFFGKFLLPATAGLKYHIQDMVTDVEKQQVFVRLTLEGVPENKNLQKGDDGKEPVKINEIATYSFQDGKIAWCWAAPDFDLTPSV